jgi:hypothetical protein
MKKISPYKNCTTSNSPIIALGEGWGYHIGHFLSDQRYGVNANCQSEQTGGISISQPSFIQDTVL